MANGKFSIIYILLFFFVASFCATALEERVEVSQRLAAPVPS